MKRTILDIEEAMTNLKHTVCVGFGNWSHDRDELARLPRQVLERYADTLAAFIKAEDDLSDDAKPHARRAYRAASSFRADLQLYLAGRAPIDAAAHWQRVVGLNVDGFLDALIAMEAA